MRRRIDLWLCALAVVALLALSGWAGYDHWGRPRNGLQTPYNGQQAASSAEGVYFLVCQRGAVFGVDVQQLDGKRARIIVSQGCRLVEERTEVCGR